MFHLILQTRQAVEITNETYSSGPYLYSVNLFISEVSALDSDLYTCHPEGDNSSESEISVNLWVEGKYEDLINFPRSSTLLKKTRFYDYGHIMMTDQN